MTARTAATFPPLPDAARRSRLRAAIRAAAAVIAPSWPIGTFIAVNPLGGLEDQPFDVAIATAGSVLGAHGTLSEQTFRAAHAAGRIRDGDLLRALARSGVDTSTGPVVTVAGRPIGSAQLLLADLLLGEPAPAPARRWLMRSEVTARPLAGRVDAETARWCAAFCDTGRAPWSMPGRDRGFFLAWRDLAGRDPRAGQRVRRRVAAAPDRPADAALLALHQLGIAEQDHMRYLQAHLSRLPGWAGAARWGGEHERGIDLLQYLAMRLTVEAALLGADGAPAALPQTAPTIRTRTPEERARTVLAGLTGAVEADAADLAAVAAVVAGLPVPDRALVWLAAYEGRYRDDLLHRLTRPDPAPGAGRPAAQLVCCIDVRSEGLRRHLEARGPYETLGFAGFFAVAIAFTDLAGGAPSALCPVLVSPRHEVHERSREQSQASRDLAGRRTRAGLHESFSRAKNDEAAPFALAEGAGWIAGPLLLARTVLSGPLGALRDGYRRAIAPPAATEVDLAGFSPAERVTYARVALTTMGLTRGFGRLVVLCGHGSTTENNPHAAALDCGACGGQRGGPNARTAAALLNLPEVRAGLASSGIVVPTDTWFVAAEHDTATDQVVVLDAEDVPVDHTEDLDRLRADLTAAGRALAVERCATLPGAPRRGSAARSVRHVAARSTDWAQVFPEWGLAGNAAFVVAPRSRTAGLDLQGRVFLHSYDADVDPDGAALETILTAPLVVGQWINCQYYFSTVEPEVFGAGTKTVHNVVGDIGVLAGQDGDLRLGLPWQSVAVGDRLRHEPMRLLAVVEAPRSRIEDVVGRNRVLQRLFGNGWVALAARDSPDRPWSRWTGEGWTDWLQHHPTPQDDTTTTEEQR